METYFVTSRKYTASKNCIVRRTKQNRLTLLSNCAICGEKKLSVIKNPEVSRLELH